MKYRLTITIYLLQTQHNKNFNKKKYLFLETYCKKLEFGSKNELAYIK